MRIAAAIVVAVCMFSVMPFAAGAGESRPELLLQRSNAAGNPRFQQFLDEYEGMVRSWWEHGGSRTVTGRWHIIGSMLKPPGRHDTQFVISIAVERAGAMVLMLTFRISPVGQANLFLAAHAAYDAVLGAILDQRRGNIEWHGPGGEETAYLPPSGAAGVLPDRRFFLSWPSAMLRTEHYR